MPACVFSHSIPGESVTIVVTIMELAGGGKVSGYKNDNRMTDRGHVEQITVKLVWAESSARQLPQESSFLEALILS